MIEYTYGSMSDMAELKKIWVKCFNDTSSGYRTFIKQNKSNVRIYVAKCDKKVVSCLYHIPCTIGGNSAHYLFGAATLEPYRGRGIMKKLINFSLEEAAKSGDKFSALFPANDSLYGYYSRFDYERKCFRKQAVISKEQLMNIAEYGGFCMSMNVSAIAELRKNKIKGNALIFPDEYIKYSVSATKNYGGYVVCSNNGYALVQEDEKGECIISELFADEEEINVLLGEILKKSKAEKFIFNYPPCLKIFNEEKNVPDGMIKFLSDFKLNEAYIGLRNQ